MGESFNESDPHIELIEKSIEAHDRYGKQHHDPEGPFKKISDQFDPGIKETLSTFGREKLLCPFQIEGPFIDYCFDQIHTGVVREVVWRIKSEKHYPVEVALHFKRNLFGMKATYFAIRGLKGGHSGSKPDIDELRNSLLDAEPFAFVKNQDK